MNKQQQFPGDHYVHLLFLMVVYKWLNQIMNIDFLFSVQHVLTEDVWTECSTSLAMTVHCIRTVLAFSCCLSTCAARENPAECIEMTIRSRWFPPGNSDRNPALDNLQQVSHNPKCGIVSLCHIMKQYVSVLYPTPFYVVQQTVSVKITATLKATNSIRV